MPRKVHNALTPIAVKAAGVGRHADGGGLYLRVQQGGARSWLFRSLAGGKARDVGLGPAAGPNALSLLKAREMARDLAALASKGEVIEGKRSKARKAAAALDAASRARRTFREVASDYVDLQESGWKNDKHRAQWRSTLEAYVYPHLGDLPVSEIETAHVQEVLQPIWTAKPETASRIRGRIENILDAARVQGLRSGENPARWRGHLQKLFPEPGKAKDARNRELNRTGHHAAMDFEKVPAFMADLAGRDALAARALEFTILTAARTGEVLGATWAEIDLNAKVWTVPAFRMKAEKEHRVPLSPRALEILAGAQPLNTKGIASAPVFPGNKGAGLSSMAMGMLMRRLGRSETVHGFRSSFRDWAAETTGFPHEVCEMALAHVIGNKAEAAYRRGVLFDKRRRLMEAWATWCAAGGQKAGGKVASIRGAA